MGGAGDCARSCCRTGLTSRELWLRFGYQAERIDVAEPGVAAKSEHSSVTNPGPDVVFVMAAEGDDFISPGYVVVTRKRLSWGPGPESTLRCGWCDEERHSDCDKDAAYLRHVASGGQVVYLCDCPHPSHAEESE